MGNGDAMLQYRSAIVFYTKPDQNQMFYAVKVNQDPRLPSLTNQKGFLSPYRRRIVSLRLGGEKHDSDYQMFLKVEFSREYLRYWCTF
jgi:hypothetical protein